MKAHNYYVYILTDRNKKVLYTGVTNNLIRRLNEHVQGVNKSSFTSQHKCHFLIFYQHFRYIDRAIAREKEIKGWSRKKKEALIESVNKDWEFLSLASLGTTND